MRRVLRVLGTGVLLALIAVQAGCHSDLHPWVEPEEHQVKILSDAEFVETRQGDFVDGYLAEYVTGFESKRVFLALEITRYLKGDRLTVTGRFVDDSVRMADLQPETVLVFEVERAQPTVPKAPDIPRLK
jgi:hypothetical protein